MILVAFALAAAPVPPGPLDFTAQTLRTEPKQRRAFLDDAVQISRGNLVVRGDHAIVEFVPEGQAKPAKGKKQRAQMPGGGLLGSEVQRFTVDGNVHVQRGLRTAEGEHGEYDGDAQVLVLTGGKEDPVLRDGPETLTGERILFHLDSEDVNVTRPRIVLRRSMPDTPDAKSTSPTRVEASKLFLDKSENLAHFTEDVVLRRGDMTVRGPRMDARYDKSGELTRLLLSGGVEMREGDRRAVAQRADYDPRARELVLSGQPRLFDRGDTLAGERITVNLDSHEVRVERAHGLLRPKSPSTRTEERALPATGGARRAEHTDGAR
ncbi:MAG: LptA/OstA family protein [Myxococcales bacterium]